MVFNRQSSQDLRYTASLCMVSAETAEPITSKAQVLVRSLNKKGARIHLDTPFIDGCHILMDVHNTTPKLIQVNFPGENPETQQDVVFLGKVLTYQRIEEDAGAYFEVELIWEGGRDASALRSKELKRLIRIMKKGPEPEAYGP